MEMFIKRIHGCFFGTEVTLISEIMPPPLRFYVFICHHALFSNAFHYKQSLFFVQQLSQSQKPEQSCDLTIIPVLNIQRLYKRLQI